MHWVYAGLAGVIDSMGDGVGFRIRKKMSQHAFPKANAILGMDVDSTVASSNVQIIARGKMSLPVL